MRLPQTISDINIFVDGIGHLGTSSKLTPPKIEQTRETQNGGGFERSIDTGLFKELSAEIVLSEYSSTVFEAMSGASKSKDGISIVCKGSIFQDGQRVSLVATLQGSIDVDDGDFEANKKVERKISMKPNRYILEINGKQQIHLDTYNMIAVINGVDFLEDLRTQIQ